MEDIIIRADEAELLFMLPYNIKISAGIGMAHCEFTKRDLRALLSRASKIVIPEEQEEGRPVIIVTCDNQDYYIASDPKKIKAFKQGKLFNG